MDDVLKHEDREHADFAPSGLKRTINCHGSHKAQRGLVGKSSAAAEEGTECHEASALVLAGEAWDDVTAHLTEEQSWIVDEYTTYCLDLISKMIDKHGADNVKVWIETRVYSDDHDDNHGTADLVIFVKPLRTVAVIDLKAGHVFVDVGTPEDPNPQLANYGFMTIDTHKLWNEVDYVRLTIVQPRCYEKPQTVTLTIKQMIAFAAFVRKEIQTIKDGDETRVAGDWCKFCLAAGRCPTLKLKVQEEARIKLGEDNRALHPRNYEPNELFDILANAEMFKVHYEGVQLHIMHEMEKGRLSGNGWKLVPKRAMAKWLDAEKLDKDLTRIDARHLAFKPKLLTPNQLADRLKKENVDFDLTDYFVKESSGFNLVRDEDPRPAARPDVFKDK